jgi:hypothetical protein
MIKPNLVISAPVSSRSCYGDRSRALISSLVEMDTYSIKIIDQKYGNSPRDSFPTELIPMVTTTLTQKPDLWIQIAVPNEFQKVGKYNIGFTAGPEGDRASPEWIEGINRMDLVVVPSEHSKRILESTVYENKDPKTNQITQRLKVTAQIEVLFEGLDLNIFNPSTKNCEAIHSVLDSIPEKNCYLISGHWGPGEFTHDHRDIGGTIRTFLEAFKNKATKNQPALVVKVSKGTYSLVDREDMLGRIRQIRSSVESTSQVPNVYLLHGDLTPDELNALYHHAKIKAMVSFTHGGGFGSSLLEFGITGKPVLAPNWSGHLDFISKNGILLQGNLIPVHPSAQNKEAVPEGANWYYTDYGYAIGIIKDVESNYKKHLVKSRKQKQYIKDNFTLDRMTGLLIELVENNVPEVKIPTLESLETYE